jgi:tetratricopeptide (TPR) repeat protein
MKSMNIEPEQKGCHSVCFVSDSCEIARQHQWGVMLPRLLIFLIFGLVLPAIPAWSSDQDFLTAEKLYRAKEFSQAELLYSQVDSNNANYLVAQLHLGTIYYLTGRPAQAEKCFSTYLRFKESPEVYCLLAGALFNQKKFDLATNSVKQALQLDPRFAKAYTVLGMIHTAENDFAHAEADYRDALKLNDNDSDTWFMLGRALLIHDDFAEAARAFERALRIDPESVRSYENLARTKDVLGDLKGAEESYKEGLRASRTPSFFDPHIYVEYGEFLLKLNRLADSQCVVEEALRTDPDHAELHYELSKVYFRMDQLKEAAHEGETALSLGGPNYKADFLLAQIYTAMGNPLEASKYASRAAQAAPNPDR